MQCFLCGNEFDPDFFRCPVCAAKAGQGNRALAWLARIEDGLIAVFLGVMLILVLLQIVMRYGFESGIAGSDTFVRHIVIWIAFLGAAIAARSGAHVRIDVLMRILPKSWHRWIEAVTNLFSFGICALLAYASIRFLFIEYQAQASSVFLGMPVWAMAAIIPVGYGIIALRFGHRALGAIFAGKREGAE
ncbi:MAG: TRAP transporter small permease [Thermodesulfobacteriota bacterium]